MVRRLQRSHSISLIGLLLVIAIVVIQSQGWLDQPKKGTTAIQPGAYTINHYIDGDTVSVNIDGKAQSVRFIGIDTPKPTSQTLP